VNATRPQRGGSRLRRCISSAAVPVHAGPRKLDSECLACSALTLRDRSRALCDRRVAHAASPQRCTREGRLGQRWPLFLSAVPGASGRTFLQESRRSRWDHTSPVAFADRTAWEPLSVSGWAARQICGDELIHDPFKLHRYDFPIATQHLPPTSLKL